MTPDKIDLHAGRLKNMKVDYVKRSVTIKIENFECEENSNRILLLFTFEGVESVSQVANFDALGVHAKFGNVNDWAPPERAGTTYIDLVDKI